MVEVRGQLWSFIHTPYVGSRVWTQVIRLLCSNSKFLSQLNYLSSLLFKFETGPYCSSDALGLSWFDSGGHLPAYVTRWSGTCYVYIDQSHLKLRDLPACVSQVLRLQVCAITPSILVCSYVGTGLYVSTCTRVCRGQMWTLDVVPQEWTTLCNELRDLPVSASSDCKWLCMWVLGIKLRSSYFQGKHFYQWSHLSSPPSSCC